MFSVLLLVWMGYCCCFGCLVWVCLMVLWIYLINSVACVVYFCVIGFLRFMVWFSLDFVVCGFVCHGVLLWLRGCFVFVVIVLLCLIWIGY